MPSGAENTIAILDRLAPLHDTEYTKAKINVNGGSAAIGCVIAVAALVFWWNPLGWTAASAAFLGGAAEMAAAHGTATAIIGIAGSGTTAVCGIKAKTNGGQRTMMENGVYHRMQLVNVAVITNHNYTSSHQSSGF